jgi:hypothetical protein
VGRSTENDLILEDLTVSRRHLKILRRKGQYFIKDLDSENGTLVSGKSLEPGAEVEIKEENTIVVGMTVIGLGETCLEYILPYLNSLDSSWNIGESGDPHIQRRSKTVQKNMELLYKVAEVISPASNVNEILQSLLEYLLAFFNRFDRGVIILIDRDSKSVLKAVSRSKQGADGHIKTCDMETINRVLRLGEIVAVQNALTKKNEASPDTVEPSPVGSMVCLPLIWDSVTQGVIYMDALNKTDGFRKDDIPLLTDVSNRMSFALENTLLFENLS